jgi:hypothetical protein
MSARKIIRVSRFDPPGPKTWILDLECGHAITVLGEIAPEIGPGTAFAECQQCGPTVEAEANLILTLDRILR